MKSQSFKLFAIAFVFGLTTIFASAVTASAQQKLVFETSFEFHVGKEKLAAGKYEVVKMNYGRYLLRNLQTREANLVLFDLSTKDINKSNAETLVFNRYGETYFLRSLYDKRGDFGRQLFESKFERQIRKGAPDKENQLADKKKKPEEVSINLTK